MRVEHNTVDRWLQDLQLIADYFSDHRLIFLLSEPNIQFPKELMVKDLLDGKVQREALALALLLVERGRLSWRREFVTSSRGNMTTTITRFTRISPPRCPLTT